MSFQEHASVLIARSQEWRQWGLKGKPSKTTARYKQFLTPLPGPNFTIPVSCCHALLADLGPAVARAFTQISQVTHTPTLTQQLNLHGQVSASDHADDFADICGPKPPQHLRFFMGNIRGLTVHQFWSKGTSLVKFLQANQCDGVALQELGLHWGAMDPLKHFSALFRHRFPAKLGHATMPRFLLPVPSSMEVQLLP